MEETVCLKIKFDSCKHCWKSSWIFFIDGYSYISEGRQSGVNYEDVVCGEITPYRAFFDDLSSMIETGYTFERAIVRFRVCSSCADLDSPVFNTTWFLEFGAKLRVLHKGPIDFDDDRIVYGRYLPQSFE